MLPRYIQGRENNGSSSPKLQDGAGAVVGLPSDVWKIVGDAKDDLGLLLSLEAAGGVKERKGDVVSLLLGSDLVSLEGVKCEML